LRVDNSENLRSVTNVNVVNFDSGYNITPDTVHMLAWRFQQGNMGASLDGGTFADAGDGSPAFPGGTNIYDGFSLGASGDVSPNQGATCKILGFAIYADQYISDTDIATIYNSGDVWSSFGVTSGSVAKRLLLMGVG
jgi:hypothetical protein